jgi:hypothetical protein
MASYVKFQTFPEHLTNKVHDLFGTAGSTADTCKIYLSNTAPNVSTHAVKADLAEFAGGTGYTAGGASVTNVGTRSSGTYTMAATDVVWTAGAGDWVAFRYVVLYNDTPTSPADPLIAYWDYASALTLGNGETFTVDFGASVFTLA